MGKIAFLGGTAGQGFGLALRLAAAGEHVVIGSRVAERAAEAARKIVARVPGAHAEGYENEAAATLAERIVVCFPVEGLSAALEQLAGVLVGKLLIDVMVPLRFRGGQAEVASIDGAPSVAELLQSRVPSARVVSAFKNTSAELLEDLDVPLEGDVLISAEDATARAEVAELTRRIPGLRPVDAGRLANARYAEAITALLINLNRRHKAHTTIAIVGLPS